MTKKTSTKTTARGGKTDKTMANAPKSIVEIDRKMNAGKKLTQAERAKMKAFLWKNDIAE